MIGGMKFSKSKCRILHLGWSNTGHQYKLGERDLRVLVHTKPNMSQQCALAAKRTNPASGASNRA